MTVAYRIVDPVSTSAEVVKQYAIETLVNAFKAECELERLQTIRDLLSIEDQEHLVEPLREALAQANALRVEADRNIVTAAVSVEDQRAALLEALLTWLATVEKEHAGLSALIEFREKMLAFPRKHKAYIKKADRGAVEKDLGLLRGQLRASDVVWTIATTRLDALQGN